MEKERNYIIQLYSFASFSVFSSFFSIFLFVLTFPSHVTDALELFPICPRDILFTSALEVITPETFFHSLSSISIVHQKIYGFEKKRR